MLSPSLLNQQYFIIQITDCSICCVSYNTFLESFKNHAILIEGRVDSHSGAMADALGKFLQIRTVEFMVFPKSYHFSIVKRKCITDNSYLPSVAEGSLGQVLPPKNSNMLQ